MSPHVRRLAVRGSLGAVLVTALVVGGTAGLGLALTAGAALIAGASRDVARTTSTLRRLRRQLEHAASWRVLLTADGVPDWDPYEAEHVTGTWDGLRVLVLATDAGVRIVAHVASWPASLTARRRDAQGGVETGDPSFDRLVRVDGAERAWRSTLSYAVRNELTTLASKSAFIVDNKSMEIALRVAELDAIDATLRSAAKIASLLSAGPASEAERVFDAARVEPLATVRMQHYQWLVGTGWRPRQVYAAAVEDPDPTVSAWGRSQIDAESGVYR